MGTRWSNNPPTKRLGYVGSVHYFDVRTLKKHGYLVEGEKSLWQAPHLGNGHIIADLRPELDPMLIIRTDSVRQNIPLVSRPTNLGGKRWYFLDESGKRSEVLYLHEGRFVSRETAKLSYLSRGLSFTDRLTRERHLIDAKLSGTGKRGPARGSNRNKLLKRRKSVEEILDGVGGSLAEGIVHRREIEQKRREASIERLKFAKDAMEQRKDKDASWVVANLTEVADSLKASAVFPQVNLDEPAEVSFMADDFSKPYVDIGLLKRMGYVKTSQILGDQLGWSESWCGDTERRIYFLIDTRIRSRWCAAFVVQHSPTEQASQLFWIREIDGPFGKKQLRFQDTVTGKLSNQVLFASGAFVLHRFDPGPTSETPFDPVR